MRPRALLVLILMVPMVPWLGGCVSGPARSAGEEAVGGFFEAAESWWTARKPELLAEAKASVLELGRDLRTEAVDLAVARLSPAIDAGVDRAAARAHEAVDARVGAIGAAVKDQVLAYVEPKLAARVDELRADLRAHGWADAELGSPGAVAGGIVRRAAAGEWEEAKAGLMLFGALLAAFGVRGGVRMIGEKLGKGTA